MGKCWHIQGMVLHQADHVKAWAHGSLEYHKIRHGLLWSNSAGSAVLEVGPPMLAAGRLVHVGCCERQGTSWHPQPCDALRIWRETRWVGRGGGGGGGSPEHVSHAIAARWQ